MPPRDRCHPCHLGLRRSPEEIDAIRSFWLHNPTHRHIEAFERWHLGTTLDKAQRNFERFRKRSARRWAHGE